LLILLDRAPLIHNEEGEFHTYRPDTLVMEKTPLKSQRRYLSKLFCSTNENQIQVLLITKGYNPALSDKPLTLMTLLTALQRIRIWIRAQQCIQVFHPTKIRTDRDVLDCTPMYICTFGFVPRAAILLPCDTSLRACQVNIHVCAFEFLDFFVHPLITHQSNWFFPFGNIQKSAFWIILSQYDQTCSPGPSS